MYLYSASAGNSDTLEYLVQLPTGHHAEDAHRRRSSQVLSVENKGKQGSTGHDNDDDDTGATGHVETEQELCETLPDDCPRKWVELEARDAEGNSALGLCAALGHAEGVRVLVEAGVNLSGGDKGEIQLAIESASDDQAADPISSIWITATQLGGHLYIGQYRILISPSLRTCSIMALPRWPPLTRV